jgi:type IV secretion system protein VirB11
MTRAANDHRDWSKDAEPFSFLESYLAPLLPFLDHDNITDLFINRPGELWIERLGGAVERRDCPDLTETRLWRLARQIANISHQGISREHPLLAARLPDGSRVQIVAPPATRGPMAIAIRRHVASDLSLDDLAGAGSFDGVCEGKGPDQASPSPVSNAEPISILREAVRARRNILVCGGTSTGKTTFLNALLREIPADERLVLIEDTPELILHQPNAVGLVAVRGELGETRVDAEDLLQASLRMRPDRIILGEIRGKEAYSFLRAVNTGHPGSMTTIHANSPEGAVEQLALLIQAHSGLRRQDVVSYVRHVVDLYVQLDRVGGDRRVARIADVRSLNLGM